MVALKTYTVRKVKNKWVILKPCGGCVNDWDFISEYKAVMYLERLRAFNICK